MQYKNSTSGNRKSKPSLVGRIAVPHNELAVLRGGHEVARVGAPVHRVHLGEVAAQRAPRPHLDPADGVHGAGGLGQRRVAGRLSALADRIFQGLCLLSQLVQLVHLVVAVLLLGGLLGLTGEL